MKLAAVVVVLVSRIALADPGELALEPVCATVEPGDILDDASRAAARRLLVRTLEQENLLVVDTGCTQTYRVEHQRVAKNVVAVQIVGPHGSRRRSNATPEKLPMIYRELVRALLAMPQTPAMPKRAPVHAPTPPAPERDVPNTPAPGRIVPSDARTPAPDVAPAAPPTSGQPVGPDAPAIPVPAMPELGATGAAPPAPFPAPEGATSVTNGTGLAFNARVGVGAEGGLGGATSFGIGLRVPYASHAIDLALAHATADAGSATKFAVNLLHSYGRSNAAFLGGGLFLGGTSTGQMAVGAGQSTEISGGGLGLDFVAGYAFTRRELTQWFVQAELALPLYEATGNTGNFYPAAFTVSFGVQLGGN